MYVCLRQTISLTIDRFLRDNKTPAKCYKSVEYQNSQIHNWLVNNAAAVRAQSLKWFNLHLFNCPQGGVLVCTVHCAVLHKNYSRMDVCGCSVKLMQPTMLILRQQKHDFQRNGKGTRLCSSKNPSLKMPWLPPPHWLTFTDCTDEIAGESRCCD